MAIESASSFLTQLPQALLGRPTTGVLDFGTGALWGLGTGDTGGVEPGILGSLGRIGMMALAVRQSKDPTAILRVKDYFDRQDAMKRDALASPDAGMLTGPQFKTKYGFVPPQENRLVKPAEVGGGFAPASASDVMGGRAQVQPMTIASPADLERQLATRMQQGRLSASEAAGGPKTFEGRRILEAGFGPQERTVNASINMSNFLEQNPIDPKSQYISYSTGADGSIIPQIEQRREYLLDDEDLRRNQEWIVQHGLQDKIAGLPRVMGRTADGQLLYDWNLFNLPAQRDERRSMNPLNAFFQDALDQYGGDYMKAAEATREFAKRLEGPDNKDPISIWEAEDQVTYAPEDRAQLTNLLKNIGKPEDITERALRKKGEPTKDEMIRNEIVTIRAKYRATRNAPVTTEETGKKQIRPISKEELYNQVDVAARQIKEGLSSDPSGTMTKFVKFLITNPRMAGLSNKEKLIFASQVVSKVVPDPKKQIELMDALAQGLGGIDEGEK